MTWTYYNIATEGTGTSRYDRYDYLSNTTSTASTSTPWQSYTYTIPYITNTYVTGQDSYYEQFDIRRYLESFDRGNREPYQHRNQTPHPQSQPQPQQVQKTPEQLKAEAEAKKAEIEAKERAKTLLLEYLDNENRQRLLDNKPLEITSKLFKNIKYHIPISKIGKIEAFKENKVVTRLCLIVKEPETLPVEDVVLTKLLHTLNDEGNMLKTANHSSVEEDLLVGLN